MPAPEVTPEDIADIRDWVGSSPTDDVVEDAWHRAGQDVDRAALLILRRRRADLVLTGPTEWSVLGDYSQKFTEAQVVRLDRQVARLEAICGEGDPASGWSVSFLVRDCEGR